MSVLLLLALCTLATGCGASYPPQPATRPSLLLSLDCNSSYVLDIASDILQDINRDRNDGYVLSLNRVSDAREHRQGVSGSPRWAGVCTSWGGWPGHGNPETPVGWCFPSQKPC